MAALQREVPERRYYRMTDLMQMIGVSRKTIWDWQRRGIFPKPIRIGGLVLYRIKDVEDFLAGVDARIAPARTA